MPTALNDNSIELANGRYLDVSDPNHADITLDAIAIGLTNTCRFGGQCQPFYSVAQHALLCAWYASALGYEPADVLACLHHDDPEGLGLGDVPRPIKPLYGEAYQTLYRDVEYQVLVALNLPGLAVGTKWFHSPMVRKVDNWALMQEAREFLPSQGSGWASQTHNWDLETEHDEVQPPSWWQANILNPFGNVVEQFKGTHAALMERA